MAFAEDESAWLNFVPLKRRKIEKDVISIHLKNKNMFLNVWTLKEITFLEKCTQGQACKSTIQSHFKEFTHFKLAQFRARVLDAKSELIIIQNIDNKCETLTENTDNKSEAPTENIDKSLSDLSDSQKENDKVIKDNKQLDIRMFIDKSCTITARNNTVQVSIPSIKKDNTLKILSAAADIPQNMQWENKWWQNKNNGGDDTENRKIRKKECPFYKKIPETYFAVDAFSYGEIPNINVYFLTHFHSDHYRGLNGKFKKSIYCTQVVTANLINMDLRVSWNYINVLALNTPTVIDGIEVTFLEANHCPGSVLILFRLSNGKNILHTGDFRAHEMMESYNSLQNINIDILYLDTTYCQPKYDFPSQEAVVHFSINLARRYIRDRPKTLLVCGSYTIGKEKIFMGIAQELKLKVYASPNKLKILESLEEPSIKEVLAEDWRQAQLHVLSMQQLSYKALHDHLQRYNSIFTNIVAIKPTGWEYKKNISLEDIKPRCSGNVIIYGIPYSEHSSFLELRRFVHFLHPHRIIPTVNVGKVEERDRMQDYFRQWIKN
uniref:DNA cross-link repair 1A protein n=1 Tax=Strigamia maritima TaxID=126957 RepID=T1JH40_STRMM